MYSNAPLGCHRMFCCATMTIKDMNLESLNGEQLKQKHSTHASTDQRKAGQEDSNVRE